MVYGRGVWAVNYVYPCVLESCPTSFYSIEELDDHAVAAHGMHARLDRTWDSLGCSEVVYVEYAKAKSPSHDHSVWPYYQE